MSYYSGSANSFADLRTALFNACTANGWTLSTDVLTKGTLAIKLTINAVSTAVSGIGLILQGGVSATGSTLNTPSPNTARLGPPSTTVHQPTFPMSYEIFLFTNPDEVYLVAKTNVDNHLWLAFGKSTYPGIGLWLSGIANTAQGGAAGSIAVDINGGNAGGSLNSTGCLFWQPAQYTTGNPYYNQDTVHVDIDGIIWAGNPASAVSKVVGSVTALPGITEMLTVQPNAWNGEAVLMRIRPMLYRASNKNSIVADLRNARYIRVDNYEPGQIISLGSDNWKVFPFYRKNTTARDGGGSVDHTGTFGWAIRYDGPM
ncbi:MAG TPA: hypothetical protein VL995_11430 [Cellvibrio sp.]|nr:hypothetical protein [Cellvibrio sp.]